MLIDKSEYPAALHWAFDGQYCLPASPTGQYFRVERWANYPYVATFATRADAERLAREISRQERRDARVVQVNA
jgi:hypothetical protein